MKIAIEVDADLTHCSAEMRRSTFVALPAIEASGAEHDEYQNVGHLFDKLYTLRLVADSARRADTLFVSSEVKRLFYPTKTELEII